jgi:hypothetical protein
MNCLKSDGQKVKSTLFLRNSNAGSIIYNLAKTKLYEAPFLFDSVVRRDKLMKMCYRIQKNT